jgi:hypothetical protein
MTELDVKPPSLFKLSLVVDAFKGARCDKWVKTRMQAIGALQVDEPTTPGGRRSYLVRAERLRQQYPDVYDTCLSHFVGLALASHTGT